MPTLGSDRPQQFLGIIDVAASRYELGIGEPEAAHSPAIELTHLRDHLLNGVHPHPLAFHHRVHAVAAVVGAAALRLYADVEVTALEIPVELGPDRGDVVVIAGGFLHPGRLLMDQTRPGLLTGEEAAFSGKRLAPNQFLEQRLPLPHGDHRAGRKALAELFIEDADGPASQDSRGLGDKPSGPLEPPAHQAQIPPELSIKRSHQAQPPQSPPQPPHRIAGIEHLEGVLQRVPAPAVHRGVDLNVTPGEHQQRGPEGRHRGQEHPLHIEHRQGGQIEDALGKARKSLVQVIGQVDRADREDRIARQAHQQHPVVAHGNGGIEAKADANNRRRPATGPGPAGRPVDRPGPDENGPRRVGPESAATSQRIRALAGIRAGP